MENTVNTTANAVKKVFTQKQPEVKVEQKVEQKTEDNSLFTDSKTSGTGASQEFKKTPEVYNKIIKDPDDERTDIYQIEKPEEDNSPKIKAKRTKKIEVENEDGTKKEVTVVEDVEISTEEYLKLAKDKLDGKEEDPNLSYEFDQDSVNEALWKTLDSDNNGYVNEDEYKAVLQDLLDVENIDDIDEFIKNSDVLNKLLNADEGLDANGDGNLSRDEYNNSILNFILTEPDKLGLDTETAEEGEEQEVTDEVNNVENPEATENTEETNNAEETENVESEEAVANDGEVTGEEEQPSDEQKNNNTENELTKLFQDFIRLFFKEHFEMLS